MLLGMPNIPFANSTALDTSQPLHKAQYGVHVAHLRGHDPGEFITRLTSVNPDRIEIPDTDDGRRLRALGPAQTPHAHPEHHTPVEAGPPLGPLLAGSSASPATPGRLTPRRRPETPARWPQRGIVRR